MVWSRPAARGRFCCQNRSEARRFRSEAAWEAKDSLVELCGRSLSTLNTTQFFSASLHVSTEETEDFLVDRRLTWQACRANCAGRNSANECLFILECGPRRSFAMQIP
ncbi:hypothetical protein RB195_024701 [Necator americanus]|uniref:Uncharacterized protein n=1 Tax=Necator americanus TaxID=51031 RepID=A0ABR1EPU5_NECAM